MGDVEIPFSVADSVLVHGTGEKFALTTKGWSVLVGHSKTVSLNLKLFQGCGAKEWAAGVGLTLSFSIRGKDRAALVGGGLG